MDWITKYLPALPSKREAAEARVRSDAGELIRIWGDLAYKVAADLSWREDIGLLHVSDTGHWMRVTLEIGRRLNRPAAPPLGSPIDHTGAGAVSFSLRPYATARRATPAM